MSIRFKVQILCLAILAGFSCASHAQSAVSFGIASTPAQTGSQASKIAVLLPSKDSPYEHFTQAVVKGIQAINAQQREPAEIILLHKNYGQSMQSQLQDAALMGATIAIGPMVRDNVEEVSSLSFLPLPIIALNAPENGFASPELMVNFALSQEQEARQIVDIALKALPATDAQGNPPKVMIFETISPLEERIANAFAAELQARGVLFERQRLTEELMAKPKFYEISDSALTPPRLEELPNRVEDPYGYQRIKLRNERAMARYRAKVEFEAPPYHAAFLAMDARTAAMVKPRLPRLTRVWGTSLINPGDTTQSFIASLTYDLQNTGFVDAPLVIDVNRQDFKAIYGVDMPQNIIERRLFAFGVDAYRLANQWMHWKPEFAVNGATGQLSFNQALTGDVQRQAQPAMIRSGYVQRSSPEDMARAIARPQ